MKFPTILLYFFILLLLHSQIRSENKHECVLLIHGLARSDHSMESLQRYLQKKGYHTRNINYPSTKITIEKAADDYIGPSITSAAETYDKIHLVTHSLGGILVRYYLQERTIPQIKSIVMLAPPNQGSEIPDFFMGNLQRVYFRLNGPAGQQLGVNTAELIPKLKPLPYCIGIIAGTKSWEPWFSMIIPGKDDGKVAVVKTQLSEMTDFITLPHTHTFIMNASDTKEQVLAFICNKKFNHKCDFL